MMALLRNIIMRAWFVYFIFFAIAFRFWQYELPRLHTVGESLSRFTPPWSYFTVTDIKDKTKRDQYLHECQVYHRFVEFNFPYQTAESRMMMGFCAYHANQVGDAINYYQKSIRANPCYFWPYYNLGVIYLKQERWEDALKYFKEAANQDMLKNIYMYNHSKVLMDVRLSDKKNDLNIEDLLSKHYGHAIEYMAYCLFKKQDYKELLNVALTGLDKNYGNPNTFKRYAGIACAHLGLLDKAAVYLDEVIKYDSKDADAMAYLSYVYARKNDITAAGQLEKLALHLHQQYGSLLEQSIDPQVVIF